MELVSTGIWTRIGRLAKKSKVRKAAISYVTTNEIGVCEGDTLVVDASDQAIRAGETSATILKQMFKKKASLYSCPGLHAKVMILDDTAIIGSANMSQSSKTDLIEAALITGHPAVVSMASAFVEQLCQQSTRIDKEFIARIQSIDVTPRRGENSRNSKGIAVQLSRPRTWLVGTYDLDDDAYPDERDVTEAGHKIAEPLKERTSSTVSWIRMTGRSKFRKEAQPGDLIINIP